MSLFPCSQFSFDNAFRDMEQAMMHNWRKKRSSTTESQPMVVDDEDKFEIDVDLHEFKPDEVKVHLDGRLLTVEGEHKKEKGGHHEKKKFVRRFSLPENCDLSALHKELHKDGHLLIDVPKSNSRRNSIDISKF